MPLATRITALATRAAAESKALRTLINGNAADLTGLTTTAKTSLMAAINEHESRLDFVELGNAVDLNTVITEGTYTQSSTAEAAAGTNYPRPIAGLLEVFVNSYTGTPGMIWQRYTLYGIYSGEVYTRANYNGTWSSWTTVSRDTGWVALTVSAGWTSGTGVNVAAYRQLGDVVRFRGTLAGTLTVATTTQIATVPAAFTPGASNAFCPVGNNGGFVGWSNVASTTGALSVHFKSPWATGATTIDLTGISYPVN